MATKTLTLSTTSIGSLVAVQISAGLAIADTAAINQRIVDDQAIVSSTSFGPSAAAIQGGIIFAGTTTTSISGITSPSVASPTGATVSMIGIGQQVVGFGLAAGSTVTSIGPNNTVQLSAAPVTGVSSGYFTAVANAQRSDFANPTYVTIPNRGVLKVLPGDVVAVDQSGWPILVSKQAIASPGSPWILT